jgi:hypothetical protein
LLERRVTLQLYGIAPDAGAPDAVRSVSITDSTAVALGFAQYREGPNQVFTTVAPGGSGTITITHLSDSRVRGRFDFRGIAPGSAGGGEGLRNVVNGEFNVRISSGH